MMPVSRGIERQRHAAFLAFLLLCLTYGIAAGAQETGPITLPFTLQGVHIFLKATVNDKPVTLVLDTGAGGNVITPEAATRLQLPPGKDQTAVVGAGGRASAVAQVTLARLGLGAAVAEKQIAYLIPLPESLPCDGLVGTPFLKNWIVTIDYAQSQLTLTPRAAFTPPANASALPLRFYNNLPQVEAAADGNPGWFNVDTGANNAITLFGPFVAKNHLRGKYSPSLSMTTGRGVGGLLYGDVVRLPQFTLGSFRFSRPVADLSRQTAGVFADRETAGNLGGELWRRFTVTIDYVGKKLYLAPNAQYDGPFVGNRSGMNVDFEKGAYTIDCVVANSPAAEAGIQVGDRLVAIDDKPAEQLKIWELTELLRRDVGTKLRLRLRTADQSVREVTLTLRDLL